ncbi:hypothetical protein B5V03_25205 [Bradyrhizobium betae]|uniref:Uncharacterized protein n=1 Tax=Bradyrhizobium betae TaxID=244734 RepID=A0A4Q1UU52_9BRAD|nr:hypothetical protein B5V03_25205 [Bradyrhizobium betae]
MHSSQIVEFAFEFAAIADFTKFACAVGQNRRMMASWPEAGLEACAGTSLAQAGVGIVASTSF